MTEPLDPEYAAALDRLLDGLEAEGPADAEVRADTDSIARALGLIGETLAAEDGATAAGTVPPATGGATVVAMSSWRSRLNPRVLAAAASLAVVVGIGIPLALTTTGGSSDEDATSAISAPEAAAGRTEADDAVVPGAAPLAAGDPYATDDAGAAGTAAASGKAAVPAAGDAVGGTAPAQNGADAPAPAAESATDTTAAAAARQAATPQFADAVACARAIVVGTVTAVAPAPDGSHYNVSILVEDWIAPGSGPVTVTHQVFGSTANSPGEDEIVRAGMRRLFVIAASPDERIYAFRQADWPETKKRIAAIRAERAGESC